MTIYTPKNLDQAKEIATLISDSPRDCLRLHAAFGAHFGGDMAITQNNAYMLKGKPSLNADAMSGVVRRSGICRFMVITSWDHEHCTYECARNDEPEQIVHTFTYTFEMAKAQGLTRNRNWQQMPMQMLRARALTLMLRAVYPDAVSGIYSPDELADNMSMSDDERAQISADSLGEELRAPSQAPRAQTPPQQHRAIPSNPPADQHLPPAFTQTAPQDRPTPQHVAQRLLDVATLGKINSEDGSLEDTEWDEDKLNEVTERAAKVLSWTDLEVFATGLWTLTQEQGSADEIDELLKTIKSLGYSEAKLGIF